ncbi:hypothetical protein [Thiocapsa bogorovii]|uniref:hypothetical protein n=1 Tax=Thiocapsa bogorovii TaxID=521689 RepID=UPI001E5274CC|nr:hypothetical protein [Thiocapsa bogorovii]UHD16371.1 hypothetical protein LT988_24540 [Thiocapsa bogorovii]
MTTASPADTVSDRPLTADSISSPPTEDELRYEIAKLREQLASVSQERRLLIEAVHSLSRVIGADRPPLPMQDVEPDDLALSLEAPMSFGPRSRETARTCDITEANIEAIVYGTILTIDHAAPTTINDDTKLDDVPGGLGWDAKTKRLMFNPIRAGVMRHGCHLGATAGELESAKKVGDVMELVKSRVLRTA